MTGVTPSRPLHTCEFVWVFRWMYLDKKTQLCVCVNASACKEKNQRILKKVGEEGEKYQSSCLVSLDDLAHRRKGKNKRHEKCVSKCEPYSSTVKCTHKCHTHTNLINDEISACINKDNCFDLILNSQHSV